MKKSIRVFFSAAFLLVGAAAFANNGADYANYTELDEAALWEIANGANAPAEFCGCFTSQTVNNPGCFMNNTIWSCMNAYGCVWDCRP